MNTLEKLISFPDKNTALRTFLKLGKSYFEKAYQIYENSPDKELVNEIFKLFNEI